MAQVKPINKKKMSGPKLAALIVTIAILLGLVVSLIAGSGILVRAQDGASSENFDVNASMMSYFVNATYQNWYQQNYYYIYLGYINFNANKPLNEQYTDASKTQTWYDYFVESSKTTVSTYLKYCEAALADRTEGFDYSKLEKDAEQYAKDSLKSLKETAKANKMDVDTYIRQYFGEYVNQSDLKKALVIEKIASDYYTVVYDRFFESMDEDSKIKYFEENLSSFVSAEYLAYTLSSLKTVTYPVAEDYVGGAESKAYKAAIAGKTPAQIQAAKIDPADYEGGAESAAYKKLLKTAEENLAANKLSMETDKALIEKLAAATTAEEFKRILLDAKYEENFKSAYDTAIKNFTDAQKETAKAALEAFKADMKQKIIDAVIAGDKDVYTEEELTAAKDKTGWDKAVMTIPAAVITKLNTVIKNATKTSSYTLGSVLGQKLFGGVKGQFDIDYKDHEDENGTNAAKDEHWMANGLEMNIENIKISEVIIKASIAEKQAEIDKETDADKKKTLEDEKKTLEDSLKELAKDLEEAEKKLAEVEKTGYYSYSAYFVVEAAHRDETILRDVGHILFKVDEKGANGAYKTSDEAKAAAQKIFDQLKATEKNGAVEKDVFETFGKEHTMDSNVFYEDVNKGDMVEEFEDWLFEATTKGAIGMVETEYGWHIMWYGGETEAAWHKAAHEGATSEDLSDWFEDLDYEVTFNNDIFATIFG